MYKYAVLISGSILNDTLFASIIYMSEDILGHSVLLQIFQGAVLVMFRILDNAQVLSISETER